MQAKVKTSNGKNLKVKVLVNSGYTYTTTSQGQEDTNETNQLLIQSLQYRWNKEQRSNQGGISRNQNQWLQGIVGSSCNGLKWNRHVFGA